jgi:hypothetical protein
MDNLSTSAAPPLSPAHRGNSAKITPLEQLSRDLLKARELADAASDYAAALQAQYDRSVRRPNGKIATFNGEAEALTLCNAALAVADDGDFSAWREWIMRENSWDNEGYPIDEDGERIDCLDQWGIIPIAPDGMDMAKEARILRDMDGYQ